MGLILEDKAKSNEEGCGSEVEYSLDVALDDEDMRGEEIEESSPESNLREYI